MSEQPTKYENECPHCKAAAKRIHWYGDTFELKDGVVTIRATCRACHCEFKIKLSVVEAVTLSIDTDEDEPGI